MEEALGPELTRALREVCRLAGVRPDRWHLVPPIARVFETVAAVRFAETVRGEAGKDARQAAAVSLGICHDTIESRLKRWHFDSIERAA